MILRYTIMLLKMIYATFALCSIATRYVCIKIQVWEHYLGVSQLTSYKMSNLIEYIYGKF